MKILFFTVHQMLCVQTSEDVTLPCFQPEKQITHISDVCEPLFPSSDVIYIDWTYITEGLIEVQCNPQQ